ncbi:AAA family ATPase [Morganella morganii]|uniref:AAA family ATPase n=1 Tax=Morganella morganii TaxID=582 RepID=UPI001BDB81AE|nr:AAA family ATPase [Morganella morganii]MBT0484723.1 AAA family ATPase [Morganella morganii subsp. morganii]
MELKKFKINKLYGYKDIELIFNEKSTIVIAENGAGKTTLINTLNAVLRGDTDELRKLKCESIEIEFNNKKYKIDISKISYSDFLSQFKLPTLCNNLISALKPGQIEDMLHDLKARPIRELRNKGWYKQGYRKSPLSNLEMDQALSIIRRSLNSYHSQQIEAIDNITTDDDASDDNIKKTKPSIILEEIKSQMREFDIIYLPTYRRIEKATLRDKFNIEVEDSYTIKDGEMVKVRRTQAANGSNIEFGLYDVESELKDISESIERRSSLGYRTLSATIIEDMMTGRMDSITSHLNLPASDELSRFLGRVVDKDKKDNEKIIDEVKRIMKDNELLNSNKNLTYFLSKLKPVIDSTKEMEEKIEIFVAMCNKYLQLSDDSKFLIYDVESLQVIVKDLHTNNPIGLEDLSSGEKQIISLMAHIYLDDTRKKIVLIDEPELSLSIEWQEHVLVDIVNSPSVIQMLAITHSPFVFNNELKTQVKSLKITKSLGKNLK